MARAAFTAMLTGRFPDPVSNRLRRRVGAVELLVLAGGEREALACAVAAHACEVARAPLGGHTAVEVAIFDRQGDLLARAGG